MRRFIRSMKTMQPIRHPNIVRIRNAGKLGPYCWIAMDFVDGESLTQVIQRIGTAGMLDWQTSFRVAVHVGRALECAFEHQIVHRNPTPRNILLRKQDKVAFVGDLMLAKALEATDSEWNTEPGRLVGWSEKSRSWPPSGLAATPSWIAVRTFTDWAPRSTPC